MQIKKLLGTQAYWVINKDLANNIGLDATVLLQHLIDLQESFFENGNFYQQQERILEDIPLKLKAFRTARKVLQDKNLITYKRGYQAKNYYTVLTDNVLEMLGIDSNSSNSDCSNSSNVTSSNSSKSNSGISQTLRINNTNNKPNTNIDDVYGKIFFKIVDAYPANRIGNRQHGLKKFKQLDIEEAKLAAINLKRYLTVAGQYTKSLQNYIEQKCFEEKWLKAEEETKRKKTSITNTTINNADSFTNKNRGFYD